MTTRAVVLYSQSDHFRKALEAVRVAYADADLAALIPGGRDDLRADGIACIPIPTAGNALRHAVAIVRTLRAHRPDTLCVLYPSPNLRILAAMSGARSRVWCGEDGKLRPLDESLPGVVLDLVRTRITGELRYAWLWLFVRLTRASR